VFLEKLRSAAQRNRSLLCVGLDPDAALAPAGLADDPDWVVRFNRGVIDATADLVCAYKPNVAFYEAMGERGWDALQRTIQAVPTGIPVIADAKRGDIGNTARAYAVALFEQLGADATTVSPYLGRDSLEPFLDYTDRAVLVLCKTSNPGGGDFQDLMCRFEGLDQPLYQAVARKASAWNVDGNVGLVVGATYPQELAAVRRLAPDLAILVPGVGAQAGDLAAAVRAAVDARGERAIITASRSVLYASRGPDWADAARGAARELRDAINVARATIA
jgi:orotidine-5'-phosphate decarboxylase